MRDDAELDEVCGEPLSASMRVDAALDKVCGEPPNASMRDDAGLDEVCGEPPNASMRDDAALDKVCGEPPNAGMRGDVARDKVCGERPPSASIRDDAVLDKVCGEPPNASMRDDAELDEVCGEPPNASMRDKATLDDVRSDPPDVSMRDDSALDDVLVDPPGAGMRDDAAFDDAYDVSTDDENHGTKGDGRGGRSTSDKDEWFCSDSSHDESGDDWDEWVASVNARQKFWPKSRRECTGPGGLIAKENDETAANEEQTVANAGADASGYRARRHRCGVCDGCVAKNCGECGACSDMIQFGGAGTKKQGCIKRRCISLKEYAPQVPGSHTPREAPDDAQMISSLATFVNQNGGDGSIIENEWSVKTITRKMGETAGTYDVYFLNGVGRRFRSRNEVLRHFGLAVPAKVSKKKA
jgi:hypothetical protein